MPGFELFADATGEFNMAPHPQSTLKGLHGHDLGSPAWDDDDFLVVMDPVKETQAPSGDLRFIVQTTTGGRQIAIVQCKKSGRVSSSTADRTASTAKVKNDLNLLRGCVQRWLINAAYVVLEGCSLTLCIRFWSLVHAQPYLLEVFCA